MKNNYNPKPTIKITNKQKEIILLLYKFRFLTTTHIQKLLNHKDPHRIKEWLSDLLDKSCVKRHYSRTTFGENTKPAIYYLAAKSRIILNNKKDIEMSDLEYIYKEHRREQKFISHSLFLADVYLFLVSQTDANEELKFFTKSELQEYAYFPDPLPDAFIAIRNNNGTRRYFLDLFDEYTPPFIARRRARSYLEYVEKSDWDENTNHAKFPSILFVCPSESLKRHLTLYTKALLEKTYDDKLSLFLTTKSHITLSNINQNIWQKVE